MTRFHIRLDLRLRFPADSEGSLLRLLRGFSALISAIALGAQRRLDRRLSAGFLHMPQTDRHRHTGLAQHDRRPRHFAQACAPPFIGPAWPAGQPE